MADNPADGPARTGPRRRAPRLAGEMRRALIVEAACRFFSDHGFGGPTRDLAASIGVTQALLYRYFASKTDLIEAAFASVFETNWCDDAVDRFGEAAGRPMVERVVHVYSAVLPRMTEIGTRLLFRAGLDCVKGPVRQNIEPSKVFMERLVDVWRREEKLAPLADVPLLEGERALIQLMHDAMMMIRVREHVLRSAKRLSDADEIRQVAEAHDAGARAVLRALHDGRASEDRRGEAAAKDAA